MPDQIINTGLYPVDNLTTADAQDWIAQLRTDLEQDGSCTLPNFVSSRALGEMALQARSIAHLAYSGPTKVSPYFFNYRLGEGEELPSSHPLERKANEISPRLPPT